MPEIAGLYYETHGPADAPPVVVSPGLGGSGAYWAPNLDALTQDHRVILYDHRGTGRSGRTLQPNLSVGDMASDALAVMNDVGVAGATFVGHALGGLIGMLLALRAPDLVRRLVVINGWAAPDPHLDRCFETRLALLRDSSVTAFLRAQPIFLYPAPWISRNDAKLREEAEGQLRNFPGAEVVEARIAALRAFDVSDSLHRLRADVLLIAAKDDMLVPVTCSERLAEGLPNARIAPMLGGHACNVTQAEIFNRILLAWLSRERLKGAA